MIDDDEVGRTSEHIINNPKHWRDRATEMRAMAEDIRDEVAKAAMLRIAQDYDKLAKRADLRSDGKRPED